MTSSRFHYIKQNKKIKEKEISKRRAVGTNTGTSKGGTPQEQQRKVLCKLSSVKLMMKVGTPAILQLFT